MKKVGSEYLPLSVLVICTLSSDFAKLRISPCNFNSSVGSFELLLNTADAYCVGKCVVGSSDSAKSQGHADG